MLEIQGIEEFEWLVLRANVEMKIGSKTYEKGEPFLFLNGDKGRINFSSTVESRDARSNVPVTMWNEMSDLYININSGTLNEENLNILAKAFEAKVINKIVPNIEYKRTDSSGAVTLQKNVYEDSSHKTFVYHNGEKVSYTKNLNEVSTDVIDDYVFIHYHYEENSSIKHLKIKRKDLPYFKMECLVNVYNNKNKNKRKMLLEAENVSLQNGFNLLVGPNVGPNIINLGMAALPNKNKDFLDYRIFE